MISTRQTTPKHTENNTRVSISRRSGGCPVHPRKDTPPPPNRQCEDKTCSTKTCSAKHAAPNVPAPPYPRSPKRSHCSHNSTRPPARAHHQKGHQHLILPLRTSPSCAAVMENLLARPLSPACLAARYRLSSARPALLGRRFSSSCPAAAALRNFSSASPAENHARNATAKDAKPSLQQC